MFCFQDNPEHKEMLETFLEKTLEQKTQLIQAANGDQETKNGQIL